MEESKKRPISPGQDLDTKKVKTEQDEISFSTSPTLKTRTIKVIPPKSPSKQAEPSFKISVQESSDKSLPIQKIVTVGEVKPSREKIGLGLLVNAESPPKSPAKLTVEGTGAVAAGQVSPKKPQSPLKTTEKVAIVEPKSNQNPKSPSKPKSPEKNVPLKEQNGKSPTKNDVAKPTEADRVKKVVATLQTMEFKSPRAEVLAMIQEAEKSRKGEIIIVNDARLMAPPSIKNVFLGHVIYTGAKSRSGNSNRAIDLDLFLCPAFSEADHFATIEVRISAEFLTYRGNIAVRKSALWGTDVYTDDSDVVAMIIHSGHYRPVDAPDPFPENPDAPSVTQAALVKGDSGKQTTSSVIVKSIVQSQINPVIAHIDSANSSSTTLVPDHDLYVTLRVLPKLIKYTGSTRYGLDSKGWGASHDGESVQVVKVEKAPSGSVSKQVKKSFIGKAQEPALPKSVVFSPMGQGLLKYTLDSVISWPAYLKSAISTDQHKRAYEDGRKTVFKVSELEKMKDYPFWRLQLSKFKLIMEGHGKRLILVKNENTLKIMDGKKVLHQNLSPDVIMFNENGLHVDHPFIDFPIEGIIWTAM